MQGSFPFLLPIEKNLRPSSMQLAAPVPLSFTAGRKEAPVIVMMESAVNGSPKLKRAGALAPRRLVFR